MPPDLRQRATSRDGEYLDALNEEMLERIQRGGEAFVSNAVVGGRYLLRACIVNFNTDRADVDALPGDRGAGGAGGPPGAAGGLKRPPLRFDRPPPPGRRGGLDRSRGR